MPTFSMRQLLEAGVHFGHNTRRWNPKMASYLFGVRNSIHIIDLQQTVPLLHRALAAVSDTVANGGRVLFVGTKRQATDKIADAAKRCGQYYVNHRRLGGMMTNWRTISNSITRLRDLDAQLAEETVGLTKKELLRLTRERDKLDRALGGIKEMGGLPDILFVIDTNKEAIAVAEANKLGIPVAAVIDSNSNPEGIDYPIPGNDDAIRAIGVYCDLMVDAVLAGIQKEVTAAKGDVGELEEIPPEKLPEADAKPEPPAAESAEEKAGKTATDEKTPAAEEMPAAKEPPPAEPAEEKAGKTAAEEPPPAEEKPTVDEPPAVEPVKEKAKEPPTDEKTSAPDEKPAEEKAEKPAPDEKPAEEKVETPATDEKTTAAVEPPPAEPAEEKAENPAAEEPPAKEPAREKAKKPAADKPVADSPPPEDPSSSPDE